MNHTSKDCFHFTENFLRMVYPAPVETSVEILNQLSKDPKMTLAEVAKKLGRSVRAIELATAKLTKEGKLRRIGPKKRRTLASAAQIFIIHRPFIRNHSSFIIHPPSIV
jgi:predicted HTH transcriptional regulator